uniref:Putative methyl transferase n=1 Tax=Streptomyces argenteolus TaxID=67274 RepID=A9ZNW3_9ACTN|nr:putative methyl transferase [Streptomyces argenteolus]
MSLETVRTNEIIRDDFEKDLSTYWETKQNDQINLLLGEEDGLYHHHFGIGDFDRSVADLPPEERESRVLEEMHSLENTQVETLIGALGDVPRDARLLDMGSGRGGTSFMIYDRFGCTIDGVTFAQYQVDFSNRLAETRGCADRVRFHYRNMVKTGFPDGAFQYVVTNETTPYVKLDEVFSELSRVLAPGGRYVSLTWCRNDAVASQCDEVLEIDRHYICRTHRRSSYFKQMAAHGLVPRTVVDFTTEAIPYFEVRLLSKLATGSEQPYLSGYGSDRINYLLIVAERV